MLVYHTTDFSEQIAELVRRGLTPDRERWIEEKFVPTGEVFYVHGSERAIRDGKLGAFEGANAGGAQADVFHGSDAIAEAAEVADSNDLVGQNRNSAEKILECLLCGECDGNAADAEASEHGGQVEAQNAERGQHGGD